ncbi:tRNA lysidine(34) synthetase TilS [Candidatus Oscillochloris fontis]|uniref:tRNA lysidine(34) synthetase TilS n=1 Tax=Candidatus Oscillochloris fontis TaxID=2496868 RepID=UPI00101CBCEA|nr:tRNA lysidine(34) synthetase TilS [Candidatus Oscillochloris fontis]
MDDLLLNRVHTFLQSQRLFDPHCRVLVAVSGGPDSLCLLHVLLRLHAQGGPALHVAHLDHGFRGAQSAAEAEAVARLCAAWGLSITLGQVDGPDLARRLRRGKMAASRQARYAFLSEIAQQQQVHALAVAHTADDQAETVLLHALRGAGPAGLRGMRDHVAWHAWQIGATAALGADLIRPLLTTTRAEIVAYCAAQHLEPADDPSNRSPHYARSRVRHQIMPVLSRDNPQIVAALSRTAQICAEDYAYIQTMLDQIWPRLVAVAPTQIEIDLTVWRELHPALRRYALRRAASGLGVAELSFAQVEAARACLDAGAPPQLDLAQGLRLSYAPTRARIWVVGRSCPAATVPQLLVPWLDLSLPGRYDLGAGWACELRTTPPATSSQWWLALPTRLAAGLALRGRRPGDRFRPAGGVGSRRLQDFFVDRKIAQHLRDAWPLLVRGEEILWVVGLRTAAQVTTDTDHIWIGCVQEE